MRDQAREAAAVEDAVATPAAPAHAPAGPGLIAHLARSSAEDRSAAMADLHGSVGNRRVTMMIARTPGAGGAVTIPAAALDVLKGMGLSGPQIETFKRGEPVLYERAIPGRPSTLAIVEQRAGLVRGGIFSIDVRANPTAALKEFMGFRQPILNLARAMNVAEIELFGAAVHNKAIVAMLERQGFVISQETIPESFGLGPAEKVQVYSKRFPVHGVTGGGGGTAPPTGGGAPPPTGGGSPPPTTTSTKGSPSGGTTTTTAKGPAGGSTTSTGTPPKPATTSGSAGVRGGPVVRGLKIGAGLGLQTLFFWWLGSKSQAAEEKNRSDLMRKKVDPEVNRHLTAQSATALKMTTENPMAPVYANITADIDYTWTESGIAANKSIENVTDIRFLGLTVSQDNVSKEQELSKEKSGFGQVVTYYATRRITFSVQVDFGETEGELEWRKLLYDVAQVVKRGMSARAVGEHTHWAGKDLKGWERWQDNQRRKWGQWTLEEQRAYEAREQWVLAYIEHTAFFGPDDQYAAALEYLKEIRRRPKPVAGERIPL